MKSRLLPRHDVEVRAPTSPVAYVRQHLGKCPSPERDLAGARAYWAALSRVCRALGLDEQADEWQALSRGGR